MYIHMYIHNQHIEYTEVSVDYTNFCFSILLEISAMGSLAMVSTCFRHFSQCLPNFVSMADCVSLTYRQSSTKLLQRVCVCVCVLCVCVRACVRVCVCGHGHVEDPTYNTYFEAFFKAFEFLLSLLPLLLQT